MASERKDYYKILGLTEDEKKLAGDDFKTLIKKKYRELSKIYHPDLQYDKSDEEKTKAEAQFKDIAEAYDVLGDDTKKQQYDNPHHAGGFDFDMDAFMKRHAEMNDLFNSYGGHSSYTDDWGEPMTPTGQNVQISVPLTLEEIYHGTTKTLKVKVPVRCSDCDGSCVARDGEIVACSHCNGTGRIGGKRGYMIYTTNCPHCGGSGRQINNPCQKCNGVGLVVGEKTVDITVPKGVPTGARLSLSGMGGETREFNGVNGNLYIFIQEKSHPNFRRVDNNLTIEQKVPIVDAILGCEVEINTIDGKKIKIKVPQSSPDGNILRVQGKGLPVYNSNFSGDLLLTIKHKMPTTLSTDDKKHLEKLKKSGNFK